MPSEIIDKWRRSGKYASINNLLLKPQSHPVMNDMTLSIQRGQAEAFPLSAESGGAWIAKKFHPNKRLDTSYLKAINSILPKHKAFRCGTDRQVLNSTSLKRETNRFYSAELAKWLTNVVLMPQIEGVDWVCMIDRIRNKEINLSQFDRITLCRNLASLVKLLEQKSISHRDLSNGNIFINPKTREISLIDFDSLYHSSLSLPSSTTVGSEGYIAPFVNSAEPKSTFCYRADRFALSILCVEFLILGPDSPYCHEGGIFDQNDICQRRGNTISYAINRLQNNPQALKLFRSAMNSSSFQYCPSPNTWLTACMNSEREFSVEDLSDRPLKTSKRTPKATITLPENPWITKKGMPNNDYNIKSLYQYHSSVLSLGGYTFPNDFGSSHLQSVEIPVASANRNYNYSLDNLPSKSFTGLNSKTNWKDMLPQNLPDPADFLSLDNKIRNR